MTVLMAEASAVVLVWAALIAIVGVAFALRSRRPRPHPGRASRARTGRTDHDTSYGAFMFDVASHSSSDSGSSCDSGGDSGGGDSGGGDGGGGGCD